MELVRLILRCRLGEEEVADASEAVDSYEFHRCKLAFTTCRLVLVSSSFAVSSGAGCESAIQVLMVVLSDGSTWLVLLACG
jgi:hypothetical protein